jgi:T5SS/PEP-CTERM-associated repeat protein
MTTYYLIGGTTNLGLGSSWSLTNGGPPANQTPTSTDTAEMDLAASILGTLTAAKLDINADISIANPVTTTVASGSTTIGSSATGSVTVSSTWNQAGYLQVGGADAGTLTIDSGGDVVNTATQNVNIGENPDATGTLAILGGQMSTDADYLNVGNGAGSNGAVTISGSSASLTIANELVVGNNGDGQVTVSNGGSLVTNGLTTNSYYDTIGASAGSVGSVTVTGAGSSWKSANSITVGWQGQGTLTVSDGGEVQAAQGFFLANNGSISVDGTSILEAGALGGAKAGYLTVDPNNFIGGVGTITGSIIDNGFVSATDNTSATVNGALTVTGSVSGSGGLGVGAQDTLALDGAVTATQGVSFNGWYGTLEIGDASGFQSPIYNFMPGDTIDLTNVQYDEFDSGYSFSYGSGGDLKITEGAQTYNFNVGTPVSLSGLLTLKPDASGKGTDVVFTSGGASPFNQWGLPLSNFFSTASGPVNGSDWAQSNSLNGGEPVWIETEAPASTYVASQSAPYSIVLTTQDWLGDEQPLVTVTTTDLIDPFGSGPSDVGDLAGALFVSSNDATASMDLVYWQASTTLGDYAFELQPITTTNIGSPTTGPSTTLTGSPSELDAAVFQPLSWSAVDNNTSNAAATEGVLAYAAFATATTESIYLQGFTIAGVASTSPVLAGTIADGTHYGISYNSGQNTFYYNYYSPTGGSEAGFYSESFSPTTGQLGSPNAYLLIPGFASVLGEAGAALSDGADLRFVEGFQNIGGNSEQIIQDFLGNGSPAAVATIDLSDTTSDDFAITTVTDPNDGQLDYTVLAYTDDNQVHLDLFNDHGIQIGSDFIVPGITSFDRLRALYGGDNFTYRVEIDYTVSDPSGGAEVEGLIYDTSYQPDYYTLSVGDAEYIGTPFDDTVTDGPGTYTVNGGGGSDTFVVPFLSSQVTVTEDTVGGVIVNSPDGVTTLELFSTINLDDARIGINGNTLTETNNDGASTISTLNVTGRSYSGYEQLYNKGVFLGTDYLFTNVADQPYSSYQYDYSAGNEFTGSKFYYTGVTGEPYTVYEYDYDSTGPATRTAFTGVTGTGYSSYEYDFVGGVFSGSKYEVTSVPSGASYSSYELDYNYAGAFVGDKFFFTNVPGQSYTDEEEDFNASGQLATVVLTGIYSQAYTSLEEDYNAGIYTGYKAYYNGGPGESFTSEEVDVSAANQLEKVVYSGITSTPYSSVEQDYSGGTLSDVIYSFTNVTGQPYNAYQVEETPGGAGLQETLDLNSGGHDLIALASGQTLTSLGGDTMTGSATGSTTFVLNAIYGADTIANLTGSDIVSMPDSEFSSFTALSAAASFGASAAVIKAGDGDTLTLDGITTLAQLQGLSGRFTFPA